MTINKSVGQMYPWVTHTFNPIRGRCPHECVYCYYQANKRYEKSVGPLRLEKKELDIPLGDCRTIFIGSSTDMWAKQVPDTWIDAVLYHCCRYPYNIYVFQSKNPARFKFFYYQLPPKTILGTTIETNFYGVQEISKAPDPVSRAMAMAGLLGHLADAGRKVTLFVSIEPVMEFNLPRLVNFIRICEPAFVSIGADSKSHHLPMPEPSALKVGYLIDELQKFTEVRIKPNLKRILEQIKQEGEYERIYD